MFIEQAFSELPLLVFTLLVPLSVLALGAMAYVGGTSDSDEAKLKKQDTLLSVPGALMLVGLIASFLHLGRPENVVGMISGLGRSPLSNEIIIAGVAIAATAACWIFILKKHPAKSQRKAWGIAVLALGIACAIGTGIAYFVPTIPVWNSPWGIIMQLGLGIAGGSVLADALLCTAQVNGGSPLRIGSILGAALVVVGMCGLFVSAMGITPSSGVAPAANEGLPFVIAAVVLVVAGAVLQYMGGKKADQKQLIIACACMFVGLFIARMVFYGCYVNVGMVM